MNNKLKEAIHRASFGYRLTSDQAAELLKQLMRKSALVESLQTAVGKLELENASHRQVIDRLTGDVQHLQGELNRSTGR